MFFGCIKNFFVLKIIKNYVIIVEVWLVIDVIVFEIVIALLLSSTL